MCAANCGYESAKWLGKCPSCDEWGSLEETVTACSFKSAWHTHRSVTPPSFVGSEQTAAPRRCPLPGSGRPHSQSGISEFDRVLGGGIVRGCPDPHRRGPRRRQEHIADPGGGLRAAMRGRDKTLYVSGEESATQIKLRAERLGITGGDLLLHNETDVMQIAAAIQSERPLFVDHRQHPDHAAPGD